MSPVIQLKHRSPRTNLSHRLGNTYGAPGSDKVYGTLRSGIRNKHSRRGDPVAAINACLRRRNPYRVDRRKLNAEKTIPAESQALIRRLIHQAIPISAAVSRGTTLGISRLQVGGKMREGCHATAHSCVGEQIPRIGKTHKSAMKARKTALQASPFGSHKSWLRLPDPNHVRHAHSGGQKCG